MGKLNIETKAEGMGVKTMKITGFTDAELSELNSMDFREMREKVLEILDARNSGIGTRWRNGYGCYNVWIMNGAVYAEIGMSSD